MITKNQYTHLINNKSIDVQKSITSNVIQELLISSLNKKNIIVSELNYTDVLSKKKIIMNVFFRTNSLSKYNKILRNSCLNSEFIQNKEFIKKLNHLFNQDVTNETLLTELVIKPLNFDIRKDILRIIFPKILPYKTQLFNRRYSLFIDFIKILSLISLRQVKIDVFGQLLGQVFKNLQKKSHNRFFSFLKKIFTFLTKSGFSNITGLKLIVKGKLLGKPRASMKKILIGSVPLQQIDSNIVFSKNHVYTIYGAFGFKLWINYKNN